MSTVNLAQWSVVIIGPGNKYGKNGFDFWIYSQAAELHSLVPVILYLPMYWHMYRYRYHPCIMSHQPVTQSGTWNSYIPTSKPKLYFLILKISEASSLLLHLMKSQHVHSAFPHCIMRQKFPSLSTTCFHQLSRLVISREWDQDSQLVSPWDY